MRAQLVRIGNSRGVRLPQKLLSLYELEVGDEFELEEHRDGILLRPTQQTDHKLAPAIAYAEMVAESSENDEWADWATTTGDGLL